MRYVASSHLSSSSSSSSSSSRSRSPSCNCYFVAVSVVCSRGIHLEGTTHAAIDDTRIGIWVVKRNQKNTIADQAMLLEQYQTQLTEVEELLQADPTNEEFVQLKKDMLELMKLTKQDMVAGADAGADADATNEAASEHRPDLNSNVSYKESNNQHDNGGVAAAVASLDTPLLQAAVGQQEEQQPALKKKKKQKPISDTFEVPDHLVVLESDSEALTNKKRRTVKNLRRQWKGSIRDAERETRQASWQTFDKKGKSKKRKGVKEGPSIWSTSAQAGVGVVATATAKPDDGTDTPKRTKSG
jgi:survival-of-motor-neuron-related-splicing factor 30